MTWKGCFTACKMSHLYHDLSVWQPVHIYKMLPCNHYLQSSLLASIEYQWGNWQGRLQVAALGKRTPSGVLDWLSCLLKDFSFLPAGISAIEARMALKTFGRESFCSVGWLKKAACQGFRLCACMDCWNKFLWQATLSASPETRGSQNPSRIFLYGRHHSKVKGLGEETLCSCVQVSLCSVAC